MAPSIVWLFCEKRGDTVLCTLCKASLKYNKSTTSLLHHLKSKHPDALKKAEDSKKKEFTPVMGASGSQQGTVNVLQPTIKTVLESRKIYDINSPRRLDLDQLLVEMVVEDMQPLSVVENAGFRRFVKGLDQRYELPSRTKLTRIMLPALYEKEKVRVVSKLQEAKSIAITTDTWTSCKTQGFITVTAHFVDRDWVLNSFVLDTIRMEGSPTSENIAHCLRSILENWSISDKINAVITDNARNMVTAISILGIQHAGCFAHTINLVVNDSLKTIEEFEKIKGRVKAIARFFKHSVKASDMLEELQKQARPEPLKVIQECETRWNSCFYMFQRFLELQYEITTVLCFMDKHQMVLSGDEVDVLKQVVKALEPFETATREMSGEKFMTASKVIPLITILHNALQKAPSPLSTELQGQLSHRFSNAENKFLWAASTFLDPRFRKHPFTEKSALSAMQEGLKSRMKPVDMDDDTNTSETTDTPMEVEEQSSDLWADYDAKISALITTSSQGKVQPHLEMRRYTEESPVHRRHDPFKWWQERELLFPHMSLLAKRFLAVPATSVPSERIFSNAGELVSRRRASLEEKNINMMLFLNKNL